jgi:hypothetical protein
MEWDQPCPRLLPQFVQMIELSVDPLKACEPTDGISQLIPSELIRQLVTAGKA